METIKLSDLNEYSGIDKSNEISLYEYGLLCKVTDNNIHCYYGTGSDESGNYNKFDCIDTSEEDINSIISDDWFHLDDILSFVGMTEEQFMNEEPINKIHDMLQYYGYENIFGSCYSSFEIENA